MIDPDQVRDAWKGQHCLVLGDGPSFRHKAVASDLHSRLTIGVNRTCERFRSDYLVCLEGTEEMILWNTVRSSGIRLWTFERTAGEHDVGFAQLRQSWWPWWPVELDGGMSPWWATVFAAYMGAVRIGVLGVDLAGHRVWDRPAEKAEMNRQWARLAAVLNRRLGCKVVNVSPSGELVALRRATLGSIRRRRAMPGQDASTSGGSP